LLAGGAFASKASDNVDDEERHPWLVEVDLIITQAEREAFESLSAGYQQQAFIRKFWEARDPFRETGRNEFREAWESRREEAEEKFRTLDGDRARVYLLLGEPDLRMNEPCRELLSPIEVWSYHRGSNVPIDLVFRRGAGKDPWRLWSFRDSLADLLDPFSVGPRPSSQAVYDAVSRNCPRGDVIARALADAPDAELLRERVHDGVNTEWVAAFLSRSTNLPKDAELIPASVAVAYPGRHRSRTVVQGLIEIDRSEAQVNDRDAPAYNFLVDGEVLREGKLFESFRYRFDLPLKTTDEEKIPLVVERYLRPGTYTLLLRLEDLNGDRFFGESLEIEVPSVKTQRVIQHVPAPADTPMANRDLAALLAPLDEANATIDAGDHTVRLIPPPDDLHIGVLRVLAEAEGEGISKVAFFLNGRRVMAKRRAPYSVELSLGDAPGIHTLEAVAYDAAESVLARDEIPINAGPHRFDIRLIEPQPGRSFKQSLRAEAEVTVPPLDQLDRVEFYLNETLLATVFQPPFVQPLFLPEGEGTAYVRAVAHLKDGNTAEDLVFVNAPAHLDEVDVQFVELYTTFVTKRGKPLPEGEEISESEVEIFEDGVPQEIGRFEPVENRPIHAALLLDTSTSMEADLRQAEKAAMRFFENVLRPQDRAAVVTFNDTHDLRVPLTNSLEVLAGGLTELVAEGETALNDSMIYTLYYLAGLRGRRAVILISDGEDSQSRYTFTETLEFAKRVGVTVYTIGLNLAKRSAEGRNQLTRLARETGGSSYFVTRADDLEKTYSAIEEELRSQLLIGYQSSQVEDTGYREVEVKVVRPGVKAKTIPGYYP